jgi:hypothetical protein
LARRRGAALAALLACALVAPSQARADGDPASDYLLVQNVFLPFDLKPDSGAAKQLTTIVREAGAAGFKIKVALIGSRFDLGAVPQLFAQPQPYAQFLGQELSFVYRGRLLVVMPNGFGYAVGGAPAPAARRVLAGVAKPGSDATKLVESATVAVQRLAGAAGHALALPKRSGNGTAWGDRIKIAAAVAAVLIAGAAVVLFRRMRAARGQG